MGLFEIINAYHYYMWNEWSEDECKKVFSDLDAALQWTLWRGACSSAGSTVGAVSEYWAIIDELRRRKLTDRAVWWYLKTQY